MVDETSNTEDVRAQRADVIVVGAGIVGLACALRLQLDGHEVTVVDRGAPGDGCSRGHAAYLSEGNIFPVASLDTLRGLPAMLADSRGPLVIRPSYLPRLAPWGVRLLMAVRAERAARSMAGLARLNRLAIESYEPLLEAAGATASMRRHGGLLVCGTPAALRQKASSLAIFAEHGIEARVLDRAAVRALEPALADDVAGAIFFPNSASCPDPDALTRLLVAQIEGAGGQVVREEVAGMAPAPGGGWRVRTGRAALHARRVVVAAGRSSDELLRPLGHTVPLEGERGYHLMLAEPGVELRRPIVIAEHHFAASPMTGGLRLAGTVEFARRDAPMDPRRADMLLEQATRYLPSLAPASATRWMGARPSLPDSLPAIGRSSLHEGLFYCFGHHHSGFMQAAVSARLVADLVAGREPVVDPAPYALDRFGRFRLTRPFRHGGR